MDKQQTIIILDGNALLHRAWHALPPLTTKDGTVVNAAYGFAMVVEKMLEKEKPDYMAVAWDRKEKTFRHELYEDYKGQRPEKEQELYDQIPIIQEILEAFGIPSFSAKGYEGDDVIATIADKAAKKNIFSKVVTGDLDALQLVDEVTNVLFFKKGISEIKVYDLEAVQERYGLGADQMVDYKALRGDPSDNIKGVPGVGDKTATELLQQYHTLEDLFANLDKLPEKYAKKLRDHKKTALDGLKLVELVRDVPIEFRFPSARLREPDMKKLLEMYRELEFRTLIRKHSTVAPPPVGKVSEAKKPGKTHKIDVVRGEANLTKALLSLEGDTVSILIAEQPADLFGATLAVAALSDGKTTVVTPNPANGQLEAIKKTLDRAKQVVTHDLKKLLHTTGWETDDRYFDLMIASYLSHPGSRAHDIVTIVSDHLDVKVSDIPTTFGTDREYETIGSICVLLPEVLKIAEAELKEEEMEEIFYGIEMPCVSILKEMEERGVELDVQALKKFSKVLKKKIDDLSERILKLAGREFNINSPSQLAEILFVDLELPVKGIKKTKTGFSTAAPELEKLQDAHEIVPLISEYRELAKLQSTYTESLQNLVGSDGRVHTSYNQTVTATGRLSSSDPNLQNIPIKTELGNEIRKAFVASKGKVLIAADYSQVELRLAAVISGDKPFIEAFRDGADIHTRTASEVWEVPESEVTKEQRRAAKAINFGILYGMGPRSLSRSTNMKMDEAKQFIEKYFEIHHAVRDYLDETKAKAHTDGFVETLFGRRRYLPEIETGVPMLVAMAERMAINMPVQGTAADVMKKAMIAVDGWLKQSDWPAAMLLQVHDEIVVEVSKEAVDVVAKGIKEMMEGVASFDVPLVVDVEVGQNWGEMEEYQK